MKFIKVKFYDNDFGSQFLAAGEKIKEYFYRECIEYDDFILEELKPIIINIVSSLSKLFHLSHYANECVYIKEYHMENEQLGNTMFYDARKRYSKYDITSYLSKIDLVIVEANIEDLEWDNGETLYIPIGDYVGDIRPFIL